jgi:hypothetical protein
MGDTAFGLAALGFWLFIGMAVLSGVWEDIKKRETQHETLRRLVQSGQPVDQGTMDRLLGTSLRPERDLRVAGLITRYIAVGVLVMALLLGFVERDALFAVLGAAGICAGVSFGLLAAAGYMERSAGKDTAERDPGRIVFPGRKAPDPADDLSAPTATTSDATDAPSSTAR